MPMPAPPQPPQPPMPAPPPPAPPAPPAAPPMPPQPPKPPQPPQPTKPPQAPKPPPPEGPKPYGKSVDGVDYKELQERVRAHSHSKPHAPQPPPPPESAPPQPSKLPQSAKEKLEARILGQSRPSSSDSISEMPAPVPPAAPTPPPAVPAPPPPAPPPAVPPMDAPPPPARPPGPPPASSAPAPQVATFQPPPPTTMPPVPVSVPVEISVPLSVDVKAMATHIQVDESPAGPDANDLAMLARMPLQTAAGGHGSMYPWQSKQFLEEKERFLGPHARAARGAAAESGVTTASAGRALALVAQPGTPAARAAFYTGSLLSGDATADSALRAPLGASTTALYSPTAAPVPPSVAAKDAEIVALQERLAALEMQVKNAATPAPAAATSAPAASSAQMPIAAAPVDFSKGPTRDGYLEWLRMNNGRLTPQMLLSGAAQPPPAIGIGAPRYGMAATSSYMATATRPQYTGGLSTGVFPKTSAGSSLYLTTSALRTSAPGLAGVTSASRTQVPLTQSKPAYTPVTSTRLFTTPAPGAGATSPLPRVPLSFTPAAAAAPAPELSTPATNSWS